MRFPKNQPALKIFLCPILPFQEIFVVLQSPNIKKCMKYNFDQVIPRRGTDSLKWDEPRAEDVLPMWVADMDFRVPPVITDALARRVEHGIFGYAKVPDAYGQTVAHWFAWRHGWQLQPEWVLPTIGVVPAVTAVIKALTHPGDKVLVLSPVYHCFYACIRHAGCEVVAGELLQTNGHYTIDFDLLDSQLADPAVRVFLLCNPHNPVGRVWTREELERVGELCLRHGVYVLADEIHCEQTYAGHTYTPFASVDARFVPSCITCVSPSKAFNLAGLQIANIVVPDAQLRQQVTEALAVNEVNHVSPLGFVALQAAYSPEGAEWLDELCNYLWRNFTYMRDYLAENLPECPVTPLEGTYLPWVDCRATGKSSDVLTEMLLQNAGLMVNSGAMYGVGGEGFLRLNIACPQSLLVQGLERLVRLLAPLCR